MNYQMGDFGEGMGFDFNFSNLLNQGTAAASTYLSNPTNQQNLLNAGMNLIMPKPPKPKPATAAAPAPGTPAAIAAAAAKDNTMLYVGLGVAGVTVLAIVAGIVMSRKK
jgi:hypothetical protein